MHCETNTNEEDKGGIELTVFPISKDKRRGETERECKERQAILFISKRMHLLYV